MKLQSELILNAEILMFSNATSQPKSTEDFCYMCHRGLSLLSAVTLTKYLKYETKLQNISFNISIWLLRRWWLSFPNPNPLHVDQTPILVLFICFSGLLGTLYHGSRPDKWLLSYFLNFSSTSSFLVHRLANSSHVSMIIQKFWCQEN